MEKRFFTCKNCGNQFTGNYCNQCGEQLYHEHHKTVGHLLEEALHFLTHFEGSLFKTAKNVFTKPGKFSVDYCNGIRKKYVKPVSFFFILVVLYLLFPRFQGLNMKLDTYVSNIYGFTWIALPLVKEKMKSKNVPYNEVAKAYDAKSSAISKIALFLLIPLVSTVVLLLFFTSRKYFFDHFIISLEISGWFIALHFLIVPFISFLAELINKQWALFFYDDNYWLGYSQIFIDLIIVSIAFKRFYGQKWWWTIPKAMIYLFIFNMYILFAYRILVLVVTLTLI
jgi:hypothetical protein